MTTIRIFTLLLCLAAVPQSPALAQAAGIDFSKAGRDEVFKDLPGVVTPEEDAARRNPSMVCVEKVVPRQSRRWGDPQIVYSCTQGSLTFESNRMPTSRERQLRGLE